MTDLYVLFEHAAGYALFRVKEFEEAGVLLPQIEASVTDLSRFNSVVKLIGFSPFKTAVSALENINNISEGVLPQDLQLFLETFLPKSSKKGKVVLGVIEPKLGASITEALGTTCLHTGVVPELERGIRFHFANLVKGFTSQSSGKAQLGLGHSYSRAKVKFNVNRVDNMIIQSIALLDQLDKDINTFAMRIREWYSYHFPELVKIVPDNYMYARVAQYIKNRKELSEESLPGLEEIIQDESKAEAILSAARSSMGMDISPIDLINIEMFAKRVVSLADYRKNLSGYLSSKMDSIAPNLSSLIGDQVGARLISHAGSLTNLAKYPASTVQILGAEKALFRALRSRGNTPKYGLLFHSTFIGRAGPKDKGRISRYIANKCSIASRLDCFGDAPTRVFGEMMKQQIEDRLKFLQSGDIPKTNISVMEEAIAEAAEEQAKGKKRKKKRKLETEENSDEAANGGEPVKRKKKKSKVPDEDEEVPTNGTTNTPKKKKKSKVPDEDEESPTNGNGSGDTPKKKKKKKKKDNEENE